MTCEQKLEILTSLGRKTAQERDLHTLLATLGEMARELARADRCSIFVYDHPSDTLWSQVAQGIEERLHVPAKKGIVGAAASQKETLIVNDAYNDPRFFDEIDRLTGYQTRTILAVPLLTRDGRTIGVFQALNKQEGLFNAEDAQMVELLADYAASLLENALLHDALKARYEDTFAALSESEKRFELIGRWANDGVWDWDIKRDKLYLSPRFEAILGYAPTTLLKSSHPLKTLIHPRDRFALLRRVARRLKDGALLRSELRMRSADGHYRWVLVRAQSLYDESGAPVRMVGSQTDITPQKEQAQTIAQLLKEQDRLIKTAIHEINTPVSVLSTHLEALSEELPHERYLVPMRSALKILSGLYDDFRFLQLRERTPKKPQRLNLSAFAADRAAYFEDIIAAKGQRLRTEIEPEQFIRFCPVALQRVIDNTLSNATKYSPEESAITLKVAPLGDHLLLEIIDEGPGIDPKEAIFQRRESTASQVAPGGFGIGLSIIKEICESHQVGIRITPNHPTGSRFGYLFRPAQ